jgi:hypothetical protein
MTRTETFQFGQEIFSWGLKKLTHKFAYLTVRKFEAQTNLNGIEENLYTGDCQYK